METIYSESTDKELAEGYFNIAKALITEVRELNPEATVIKNWNSERGLVIDLIESCHKNIGDDFWLNPFDYLQPKNFK